MNIDHIARHGIEPEEAESALLDPGRVARQVRRVAGEQRSAVVGASSGGRLLFVVFTRRRGVIRVVTARDAMDVEKRVCRKRGK